MKANHTILTILGLAVLMAAPATAQEPAKPAGAKTIGAKTKTPVQGVEAKDAGGAAGQEPAPAPEPAPAAGPAPAGKQGGRFAGKGEVARAHMDVLKPVAMEEARYRKRIAQLERIESIAVKNGKQDQLGQVEELRVRNDAHHDARLADLRAKYGDEKVNAALGFIEKHGKGKAVQMPRSKAGREKLQEQTGADADRRAREAKEQRDRAKEKIQEQNQKKP